MSNLIKYYSKFSRFRTVNSVIAQKNLFSVSDVIPLSLPLAMLLFGNGNIFIVLRIWLGILVISSFIFGLIGLNAGHHHPETVHEGDKLR